MRWPENEAEMCALKRRATAFYIVVMIVFAALVTFALVGCTGYNPALYPSYDTLNPSEKVRVNPLSTFPDPVTGEQMFVVNSAFLLWVQELKEEVLKLRKGAKSGASDSTPQE